MPALETEALYLSTEQVQPGQQQCLASTLSPPPCLSLDLEDPPLEVRGELSLPPSESLASPALPARGQGGPVAAVTSLQAPAQFPLGTDRLLSCRQLNSHWIETAAVTDQEQFNL